MQAGIMLQIHANGSLHKTVDQTPVADNFASRSRLITRSRSNFTEEFARERREPATLHAASRRLTGTPPPAIATSTGRPAPKLDHDPGNKPQHEPLIRLTTPRSSGYPAPVGVE
jgi:hypothetical protein